MQNDFISVCYAVITKLLINERLNGFYEVLHCTIKAVAYYILEDNE